MYADVHFTNADDVGVCAFFPNKVVLSFVTLWEPSFAAHIAGRADPPPPRVEYSYTTTTTAADITTTHTAAPATPSSSPARSLPAAVVTTTNLTRTGVTHLYQSPQVFLFIITETLIPIRCYILLWGVRRAACGVQRKYNTMMHRTVFDLALRSPDFISLCALFCAVVLLRVLFMFNVPGFEPNRLKQPVLERNGTELFVPFHQAS